MDHCVVLLCKLMVHRVGASAIKVGLREGGVHSICCAAISWTGRSWSTVSNWQ